MGDPLNNIDLVRFSQKALPLAKQFDKDKNKTLDSTEFAEFMTKWDSEHSGESPLLMQLHIKSLTENAARLAEMCDNIDKYKGVLTEEELKMFMEACEKNGLKEIFKDGISLRTVLTGEDDSVDYQGAPYKEKPKNVKNDTNARIKLFENWMKLDIMSYQGSDKFFHAVGNFEAMQCGNEDVVKSVCGDQDEDKRNNTPRNENDYTEDLYANFLGREFGKMYPKMDAHDLMSPLAPTGFDVEESKESVPKLLKKTSKNNDGYISNKVKKYFGYFKENYILSRFISEMYKTSGLEGFIQKFTNT